MKKTVRNMLIMLGVLVVLGGAAALLLLNSPETGEESSAVSSSTTETILEKDPAQVSSISVENAEGGFELIPVKTETETSLSSGEESGSSNTVEFTLKGYETGYDLETSQISSSAKSVLTLEAAKNLGTQENLEQYGLSGADAVTVTIQNRDGSSQSLVLGNKAGETAGKYVLLDGAVYIVSGIADQLWGSPFAFFSKDVYSVPDRVEETVDSEGSSTEQTLSDVVYSLKLSGADFPQPIEIEYNEERSGGYGMLSPIVTESGSTKFNEMVESLKTLTADSVAAAGLSQEILKQYGLDEPAAQLEFDMNGEKHVLKVSGADSAGVRYLTADSKDVVFQVSSDKVEKWADATVMDLRMSYVWLPNITEVSGLTITVEGDMAYAYEMTRVKNEEKSKEDKVSYDLTVKNAGGKPISYEGYQTFYKELIGLSVLSCEETAYSGTPVFRGEYEYFDGGPSDVVEFYTVENGERYAAVFNGQFNGLVRKSEVDAMIGLLPQLESGALGEEGSSSETSGEEN